MDISNFKPHTVYTIYVAATLIALVAPWWALALNVAVRVYLLRLRYQPVPLVAT